jgi:SAM-dependent methyltransferase
VARTAEGCARPAAPTRARCDTGDVARARATVVGPDGLVVGINSSDTMLAEAARRHGGTARSLVFRRGDVKALDEHDGAFDAVMCERVLQHVREPVLAVRELVRVTRPGGRIVTIDTDWGMHAVHGANPVLTARILDARPDNAANRRARRQLAALFADAGLLDSTVVAQTLTSTDPQRPLQPPFTTMAALPNARAPSARETARHGWHSSKTPVTAASFSGLSRCSGRRHAPLTVEQWPRIDDE